MSDYKKASAFFADMRRQHRDAKQPVIVRETVKEGVKNVDVTFMVYMPKDDLFCDWQWVGPKECLDNLRASLPGALA